MNEPCILSYLHCTPKCKAARGTRYVLLRQCCFLFLTQQYTPHLKTDYLSLWRTIANSWFFEHSILLRCYHETLRLSLIHIQLENAETAAFNEDNCTIMRVLP